MEFKQRLHNKTAKNGNIWIILNNNNHFYLRITFSGHNYSKKREKNLLWFSSVLISDMLVNNLKNKIKLLYVYVTACFFALVNQHLDARVKCLIFCDYDVVYMNSSLIWQLLKKTSKTDSNYILLTQWNHCKTTQNIFFYHEPQCSSHTPLYHLSDRARTLKESHLSHTQLPGHTLQNFYSTHENQLPNIQKKKCNYKKSAEYEFNLELFINYGC